MIKELELLKKLENLFGENYDSLTSIDESNNIVEFKQYSYKKVYFEPIRKALQALDIINTHNVQFPYIKECECVEEYNSVFEGLKNRLLTEEEFKIVKETLNVL